MRAITAIFIARASARRSPAGTRTDVPAHGINGRVAVRERMQLGSSPGAIGNGRK